MRFADIRVATFALVIGLTCQTGVLAGQGVDDGRRLQLALKSGAVDTSVGLDIASRAGDFAGRPGHFVLQLDGPINAERRAALAAAGVRLEGYLPEFAYLARLDSCDAAELAGLGFVRWIGAFDNAWKLDPELGSREFETPERQTLQQQGQSRLAVVLFPGADVSAAALAIADAGGVVSEMSLVGSAWHVDVAAATSAVGSLAAIDEIQFIEDAPEGVLRNATVSWIVQSNIMDERPVWDQGLHGEGQIVGLIDGTPKVAHCMFDDPDHEIGPDHRKFVALRNAGNISGHGTHVAGTLAGDASVWGEPSADDGMALAARISFSEVNKIYQDPSTLYPRLVDAYNDGARVHSNSWGDDSTTNYTTWCQQIDQFVYEREDALVLFAISNRTTIRTPENAKNLVAVAGTKDTPNQDQPCSGGVGPTKDGRRRPEVLAPSCSIRSADSSTDCSTKTMSGTSMAAPAVSGAATLVRQYFVDGFYPNGVAEAENGFSPSAALVRAMVTGSARDLSGVSGYPTDREGWGRVLLDDALYFDGDARKLLAVDVWNAEGLETGDVITFDIDVVSDDLPLQVTLAFTEPPATVNSETPVVNDLSLSVRSISEDLTYLGNVFDSGQSTSGGNADPVNNLEQVLRLTPQAGRYRVRIDATAVNEGTQGYAVIVTGDVKAAAPILAGDVNCDGDVTFDDIDPFVQILTDQGGYRSEFPFCDPLAADTDQSGAVDFDDIDSFVELLTK